MTRYIRIAVSLCVFALSMAIAAIRSLVGVPPRRTLTIIYYHAVPKFRTADFTRQMQMLARRACVVAADWDGGGVDRFSGQPRRLVAITFDDAFESVLDNALPVLAAHGFHCTIFAPSGCLGQAPAWSMENQTDRSERVADASRLAQLPRDCVTIGSHTVTHPHLTELSEHDAREELARSMRELTEVAGRSVDLLAFPYGDHNDAVVGLCRDVGYRHVFSIQARTVCAGEFVRGRVATDASDGKLEFFLKINGAYRWLPIAWAIKRKLRPLPPVQLSISVPETTFPTRESSVVDHDPPSTRNGLPRNSSVSAAITGRLAPFKGERRWRWQFLDNPYRVGLPDEISIWIALDTDQVVGQIAVQPAAVMMEGAVYWRGGWSMCSCCRHTGDSISVIASIPPSRTAFRRC